MPDHWINLGPPPTCSRLGIFNRIEFYPPSQITLAQVAYYFTPVYHRKMYKEGTEAAPNSPVASATTQAHQWIPSAPSLSPHPSPPLRRTQEDPVARRIVLSRTPPPTFPPTRRTQEAQVAKLTVSSLERSCSRLRRPTIRSFVWVVLCTRTFILLTSL